MLAVSDGVRLCAIKMCGSACAQERFRRLALKISNDPSRHVLNVQGAFAQIRIVDFDSGSRRNCSRLPEKPIRRCNDRSRAGARLRRSMSGLRPRAGAHRKIAASLAPIASAIFCCISRICTRVCISAVSKRAISFPICARLNVIPRQRRRDRRARREQRRERARVRRLLHEIGFLCYRRSSACDSIGESIFVKARID